MREACGNVRAAVTTSTVGFSRRDFESLPRLEILACFGPYYDLIDVGAAKERSVAVSYTPDSTAEPVADLAMGMIVAVMRRLCEADRFVRAGKWPAGRVRFGPRRARQDLRHRGLRQDRPGDRPARRRLRHGRLLSRAAPSRTASPGRTSPISKRWRAPLGRAGRHVPPHAGDPRPDRRAHTRRARRGRVSRQRRARRDRQRAGAHRGARKRGASPARRWTCSATSRTCRPRSRGWTTSCWRRTSALPRARSATSARASCWRISVHSFRASRCCIRPLEDGLIARPLPSSRRLRYRRRQCS